MARMVEGMDFDGKGRLVAGTKLSKNEAKQQINAKN